VFVEGNQFTVSLSPELISKPRPNTETRAEMSNPTADEYLQPDFDPNALKVVFPMLSCNRVNKSSHAWCYRLRSFGELQSCLFRCSGVAVC